VPEYRLVKHRDQWSLAYTEPGRGRVRVATGTADRGVAEARASAIWRTRSKPKSERVADLWPPYVADRAPSEGAKTRMRSLWKQLEPHFGYKLGRAITKADCRAYTDARKRAGKSNSTIKTELEALRACLRWHYGKEAPQITAPPPSKPRERYLTHEEVRKLLESIETPHVRLFVTLALATGARMSAILDLTWDRVDFTHGTIDFNPAGRDITNKRRVVVPMNKKARDALEEAHKGALTDHVIEYGGKPVKSVKRAIAAAARRAGVPCSPHVFRHTAGVWMAQADVPMQKIAQFLGHTSSRVTETVYARYSPRFMADAAGALDW
jgi:integrase